MLGLSAASLSRFASAALLLLAAPVLLQAAELRELRLEPGDGRTRVVLELSAPAEHRFFVLDGPRRAVIDLRASSLARPATVPPGRGLATRIRTGPQPNGDLRVVVEMPEGTGARVAREAVPGAGSRLVLELGSPAVAKVSPSGAPRAESSPAPATPVRAAHAPPASGREVVVAIDAGHGGQDPGAIGPAGTREKDVVLKIARELAARVNREPGMRAVLTRDGDYFLSLRQRIRRARDAGADIFVSVHADAVLDRSVSGSSVYVLSDKGATDEQARWLAERENAADLKGGISLEDKDQVLASVLLDLSQSASIASSMQAAERVLRALGRVNTVRKPAVQQAGFVVLKSPDIPSMLVETAFISNPGDEQLLRREAVRTALAEAIFRGVHAYFTEHPPEGTRFALERRSTPVAALSAR